jgi:hypothetical protein
MLLGSPSKLPGFVGQHCADLDFKLGIEGNSCSWGRSQAAPLVDVHLDRDGRGSASVDDDL